MALRFNRFQDRKAFIKAKAIAKKWLGPKTNEDDINLKAAKLKKHRAVCSCEMCRNPRTAKSTKGKEKLTQQERKTINWKEENNE